MRRSLHRKALLVLAALAGVFLAVRPPSTIALPISFQVRQGDDLGMLRDERATAESRVAACRRLLAATDARTQKNFLSLLIPGASPASLQDLILREVEVMAAAPAWLVPQLIELYRASPGDRQPAILRACASIRTRESVRFLLSQGQSEGTAVVREAAFAGLARLTGRADLGSDFNAWTEWFTSVQWLPEHEWRRVLAEGLARRSDELATSRARTVQRLVDSERQRALDMDGPETRSAVLASLLADSLPELRRLGVELTNRELANASMPTAAVGAASLALLKDPSPEFRIAGADLVDRLVPDGAVTAAADALVRETDPLVAAVLLRQVQRSPTAAVRPVVLSWLQYGGPALNPAIEACAALLDAGVLQSEDDRWAVLGYLRSIPLTSLPVSGLKMLVDLGSESDRGAVAGLLTAPDTAVRSRAAQAASTKAPLLDSLLHAARNDPALYGAAAAAVTRFRPNPAGFQSLVLLPAPSPDVRASTLGSFSDKLTDGQVISIAPNVDDLALRELLLARFANKPVGPAFMVTAANRAGARSSLGVDLDNFPTVAGMLLLAQTRLQVHKPAGALTLLEALEPVAPFIDRRSISSMRTVAFICTNRLDEPEVARAPVGDWIEGLALSADLPHAPDILGRIDGRIRDLTPADERRLQTIRARVKGTASEDATQPGK